MPDNSQTGTAAPARKTARIELTFEYATFHLDIKAEGENHDVFMAMLQQAQRFFETQLRQQAAMQLQDALREAARDSQIRQSLRKGH